MNEMEGVLIEKYKENYSKLGNEFNIQFKDFFDSLRDVQSIVNLNCKDKLTEGAWTLHGILHSCYDCYFLTIEQIITKNKKGIAAGLRGLIENIGAILWIHEEPLRAPNLVRFQNVKVGKLVNKGYIKYPDLKTDYENYSEFFHPARNGHLLGLPELTEEGLAWKFEFGFSDWFISEFSKDLVKLGKIVITEFIELKNHIGRIVISGKTMMELKRINNLKQDNKE